MPPRTARTLTLPSGRVVEVHPGPARGGAGLAQALEALLAGRVLALPERTPVDPRTLPLEDAQVLRVVLVQLGALREGTARRPCENCGVSTRARPAEQVPLGPYVDAERDEELDAPFDFARAHDVPPFRAGRAVVRSIELAPRTLADVEALWRRGRADAPPGGTWFAAALGVRAIGPERRAGAIARLLADPRCFEEVARLWLDAHYGPRLSAAVRCPSCGARVSFPAPAERELPEPPERPAREGFPEIEAFEALVRRLAPRPFRLARARNVDLVVDDGVPHCDEGGAPLLGSYLPASRPDEVGPVRAAEIRLYYRTFSREWRFDPGFDLDAEIEETIRHELEHHVHALAGVDPMDDDERGEIADDERREIGSRALRRRVASEATGDFVDFVKRTWLFWLIVFAIVAWLAERGG